ncbi:MAG: class I poly(R)-hydroxyalkanoic acid synthase [Thiotrichales bacterium]|nr:class I poly(R)-hydroxyalkanoic acid synthase [Thiotrichales bacterium]
MSDQPARTPAQPDLQRLQEAMSRITEQSQRIAQAFVERQASSPREFNPLEPAVVSKAYQALWQQMLTDPKRLVEAQVSLWQDYAKLWENTARRMAGEDVEPAAAPEPGDRRFKHDDWSENPLYDHIKQSYLLASKFMLSTVRETEGLDAHTAHKVDFYTRQFIDALAPTNFAMTNPEVARRTVETGGENLVQGLSNMLEDLERGQGQLRVRMTDLEKFKLGENVAVTPGKVVFENDLMQLLQYVPTTEAVRTRPLLVVPPWINKYYILDLRPKNSFIKWAVDQGHTVFVISWVNPDERLAEKSMDDYLLEGPVAALDAIGQATGESRVNAIGYCLGGTLLAATLAYLKARDAAEAGKVEQPSTAAQSGPAADTEEDGESEEAATVARAPDTGLVVDPATEAATARDPAAATGAVGRPVIESATFFTTMIDFEEPGELGVFIDEEQLSLVEESMEEKGYFDGAKMAEAFNLLRANDLIWSFVINNYLMGKDPFPFDLLYWNSDSTRMPRAMHSAYLRDMYQNNRLREPGGITLDGVPIDLTTIDVPVYILSTREDHIAPWRSTYAATGLYRGPVRFVLAMSGHIAGVVNPPSSNKYGYFTGELAATPDAWLEAAAAHDGSWWPDWDAWVSEHDGGDATPREPGDGALPVIEDAPGRYVKVRIE